MNKNKFSVIFVEFDENSNLPTLNITTHGLIHLVFLRYLYKINNESNKINFLYITLKDENTNPVFILVNKYFYFFSGFKFEKSKNIYLLNKFPIYNINIFIINIIEYFNRIYLIELLILTPIRLIAIKSAIILKKNKTLSLNSKSNFSIKVINSLDSPNPNIAYLLVGELRELEKNFQFWKNIAKSKQLFISTSIAYLDISNILKDLGASVIIEENYYSKKIENFSKNLIQWNRFNQAWDLMENQELKYGFTKYKVVKKLRSDFDYNDRNLLMTLTNFENGVIESNTDLSFSGQKKDMKLIKNFLEECFNFYYGNTGNYLPLNYLNILECDIYATKWNWFKFPSHYISDTVNPLQIRNDIKKNINFLINYKYNSWDTLTSGYGDPIFSNELAFAHFLNKNDIVTKFTNQHQGSLRGYLSY